MKYLLIALICCFVLNRAKSQTISNVNYDEIKHNISLPGDHNYMLLIKRISAADTTLTAENYKDLYYGQVFQNSYTPYGENNALIPIQQLILRNDLDSASVMLDKYLGVHPVSLGGIYDKIVIYSKQKNMIASNQLISIYKGLIATIMSSGDGKTDKSAMVVANVPDEYKVLPVMHVKSIGQSLTPTDCDKQVLYFPNDAGLKELYFNVSKALDKGFN